MLVRLVRRRRRLRRLRALLNLPLPPAKATTTPTNKRKTNFDEVCGQPNLVLAGTTRQLKPNVPRQLG